LKSAVESGNVDKIWRVVRKYGRYINYKSSDGLTLMMYAASKGYTIAIKYMLAHEWIDPHLDLKDDSGKTALMYACAEGHTDIVKLLSCHNFADDSNIKIVETAAKKGYTALGRVNTKEVTRKKKEGDTFDERLAIRLEKIYVELDTKDNFGKTALIYAIDNGHTDIVKILLHKGAGIDVKDKSGKTALMYACAKGHTDIAKILVENGASIYSKDKSGKTALIYAEDSGNTEIEEILKSNDSFKKR
jgi:ankyrin repeat protein